MASPPTTGTPSPYFNAVFPGPLITARPTADATPFAAFPRPKLAAGFTSRFTSGFTYGFTSGFTSGFDAAARSAANCFSAAAFAAAFCSSVGFFPGCGAGLGNLVLLPDGAVEGFSQDGLGAGLSLLDEEYVLCP